ncbi:MAG: Gfo/Idh/MocA family oxidoreductase [Chloroflexi bacterium]|nr:Gfo/Idh/MocA family oxidoreductase [Chloroflexota bacterium]
MVQAEQTTDRISGRPIRVGLVGCGTIARNHIRALLHFAPDTRITALASRSQESIEATATYIGEQAELGLAESADDAALASAYRQHRETVPATYTEWTDLIADPDVDAVIVTTPPFLHCPVTLSALEAGKHVLCEKPLAVSLREADEMIGAAATARRILSTVSQGRFAPEQQRMRALVQSGLLGKVFFAKADGQWYRPPGYYELWWRGTWEREGGGAATGQGIHILDQLLWILGKRPVQVFGKIDTFVHPVPRLKAPAGTVPIEDTALAVVTFEDGTFMEFCATVSQQLERSQIEIAGEHGAVQAYPWSAYSVNPETNARLADYLEHEAPALPETWRAKRPETDAYRNPGPNLLPPAWSMAPQVGDFLTAIQTGQPSLTGGAEGRRALEVLAGLYSSAILKRPVDLPISPDDPFYDGVANGIR